MKKYYLLLLLSSIIMWSSTNLSNADDNNFIECKKIAENTYECTIHNQEEGGNGPPDSIIIGCSDSDPSSSCLNGIHGN